MQDFTEHFTCSLDKHNQYKATLNSSLEIEKKGYVNHVGSIKYLCTFRSPFCVCLKFMHSISGRVLLHFETYTLAGILAFTPICLHPDLSHQ